MAEKGYPKRIIHLDIRPAFGNKSIRETSKKERLQKKIQKFAEKGILRLRAQLSTEAGQERLRGGDNWAGLLAIEKSRCSINHLGVKKNIREPELRRRNFGSSCVDHS